MVLPEIVDGGTLLRGVRHDAPARKPAGDDRSGRSVASTSMTSPFRFAVQARTWAEPADLERSARDIEALGYDEMYSFDHIGTIDPFVPLVVAARSTTTLRVGPLVLNNEFHQPALLARTVATVDRMTGGRLVLGLGTGYAQSEHDAIGLELRPPRTRVDRFAESLQVLRDLLDTGACHRTGEHHTIDIDEFGVAPTQGHVPFLIGGYGRRMVRIAGRYADIFQFTGLVHDEEGNPTARGFALDQVIERARWLDEAAGDRNDAIERSSLVQMTHIGGDAPSVSELAQRFETDEDVMRETPFALVGSVEQVVDRLERLREQTGISHYVVREPESFAPVVDALRGR
jgi:probable F420-dependent oxidoreductase